MFSDLKFDLFRLELEDDSVTIAGLHSKVYGFGTDSKSFRRNGYKLRSTGSLGLMISKYGLLTLYTSDEIEVSVSPDGDMVRLSPSTEDMLLSFSRDSDSIRSILQFVNRPSLSTDDLLEFINGSMSGYVPEDPTGFSKEYPDFWRSVVQRSLEYHDLVVKPLFLSHPERICFDIWDQFTIGDGVMLAPMKVGGIYGRLVYIPNGRWMFLENREIFSPGVKFVEGRDPLIFLKGDSILYRRESNAILVHVYLEDRAIGTVEIDSSRWLIDVKKNAVSVRGEGSNSEFEWVFLIRTNDRYYEVSFTVRDEREVRLN